MFEFLLYLSLDDGEVANRQQDLVVQIGLARTAFPEFVVGLLCSETHFAYHFTFIMKLLGGVFFQLFFSGVDFVDFGLDVYFLGHGEGVL